MRKEWSNKKIFKYLIITIVLVLVGFWLALFILFGNEINSEFRESEAFHVAKEEIQSDSLLISTIGNIEKFGSNIGGSYKAKSHANFQFKVFGEKGTIRVRCRLIFQGNLWVVESLEY